MKHYIDTTYKWMVWLLAVVVVGGALQSCRDDAFDDYNVQYPDGVTTVKLAFDFEPLTGRSLASRGGNAPAGDVVKDLEDFSILLYDTRYADESRSGKLTYVKHYSADDVKGLRNGITVVENQNRTDADASNGSTAEAVTKHVELLIDSVPYGPYKAYAVANLGRKASADAPRTSTQSVLESSDIDTPEALAGIKAQWDNTNMLNNAQMTGFFSQGKKQNPTPGSITTVDVVKINRGGIELHSWLRRLVSKVTVTFDPSGLRKGITVTIKKVTVRDIASSCYLGMPNRIGPVDGEGALNTDGLLDPYNNHDTELTNGEWNHYIEYDTPLVLTSATNSGDYIQTDDNFKGHPAHQETAKALFFFENMQGEVKDKDKNGKLQDGKLQDENGDGIIDYPNANNPDHADYTDNKDGLAYGTYIEVEADYDARTVGHIGRGTIKYRFMIGKNVTTNCDAERNHHYKLKMRFMGNANEVDWHIDYDETPGFYGPNPYYVSYLYNRMTYYPIKIAGEVVDSVTMTIIQNEWSPNNAKDLTYLAKTDEDAKGNKLKNDEGEDSVSVDRKGYYNASPKEYDGYAPWLGFLSLAQHMDEPNVNIGFKKDNKEHNYLYNFWNGNAGIENGNPGENVNTGIKLGVRTYSTSMGEHDDRSIGTYIVTKDPNSTTINVPFFTRQKQLQKELAFTGNNPYVGYEREARVKIDYKLKINGKEEPRSDTIKVYQVRRIVNPKGVWRAHNSMKPFHVKLMEQKAEGQNFTPATSKGPWRAYVTRGNTSFISLNGKNEVRGGDGTEMDFTINFRGTIAADQNRCAVIRVEYNNYSCHHLIFVRQGSAPILLSSKTGANGKKVLWHTGNVEGASGTGDTITVTEASSPINEGSMFRFGNLEVGIVASENRTLANSTFTGEVKPEYFDPVKTDNPKFKTTDGETTNWNDIWSLGSAVGNSFKDVKIKGNGDTKYRVATYSDYDILITKDNNINYGYGVLYGNAATETATKLDDAYGGSGMRGVFVYNQSTSVATYGGNNVFFPIGSAGYGHRKQNKYVSWSKSNRNLNSSNGVLQYAARPNWYSGDLTTHLPLFFDIFRSQGALYWIKTLQYKTGGSNYTVLDVNYQTLDFNIADDGVSFGDTAGKGSSDACFVRLVEDE